MPVPVRSMKFWINAFIPRDVTGYTLAVPAGTHLGKTMIPGPNPLSDCYLTDQRGFTNDIHAKSRMHSEFRIEFNPFSPIFTQWHHCDSTTELDCGDGDEEGTSTGNTSRMKFTLLRGSASSPTGPFVIEMDCSACNPQAPTSRVLGDIDYRGRITVSPAAPAGPSIEIDIIIDSFPAFEAYATINDGAGVMMLNESPPLGNTVMNLPGTANRPFKRLLEDRGSDGIFETLTVL